MRTRRRQLVVGVIAAAVMLATQAPVAAVDETVRPPIESDGTDIKFRRYKNRCERPTDLDLPSCSGELKRNRLRGYSFAGYKGGGVELPAAATATVLTVSDGELRPDDPGQAVHNRTVIQDALDAVPASADSPQAVELPAGKFYVAEGLMIDRSGVVLRGQGQGADDTVLVSVNLEGANQVGSKTPLIQIGAPNKDNLNEVGPRMSITNGFTPAGALKVSVAADPGLRKGDHVVIVKTVNEAWIDQLGINDVLRSKLTAKPNLKLWKASDYTVAHERRVAEVKADRVILDAPLLDPIYREFGGGYVVKIEPVSRIREVAVESLRIETESEPYDLKERGAEEYHTRRAVMVGNVEDAWISALTCRTVAVNCVNVGSHARHITVQDAAAFDFASSLSGGRRYSFAANGRATGILFQRLYTSGGRHDAVTGSRVPGPIVWLDMLSTNGFADAGPHHRYATGLLFDNMQSGNSAARNRKASGSGHGWAGAQVVFWRPTVTASGWQGSKKEAGALKVDAPPGAMNFVVGGTSDRQEFGDGVRVFGHNNSKADGLPRSLYLAELESRKGASAVSAVTTVGQRRGEIYQALERWAGEGAPPR